MDVQNLGANKTAVHGNASPPGGNPALGQDNPPGLYAREIVDSLLTGIEQARIADRLELLAFLSLHTMPGNPHQTSFSGGGADPGLHQVQESLVELEMARANVELERGRLLQGIKASLPAYMREAIGEPVQHRAEADHDFIDKVKLICKAQRAGAEAVRQFSDCDNQTKLKLLGFSHSRFFVEDMVAEGLFARYEEHKRPYLHPQQVGFAYKDGFNAMLIEGLPENQKVDFKKIMTEPDYEKRKEALQMAILKFLETPDADSRPRLDTLTPAPTASAAINAGAAIIVAPSPGPEAPPSPGPEAPPSSGPEAPASSEPEAPALPEHPVIPSGGPEDTRAPTDSQYEAEAALLMSENHVNNQ